MKNSIQNNKKYLQVVDSILLQIINQTIVCDGYYYTEQILCDRFCISRPTLREALRILEFLGISKTKPHQGICFCYPNAARDYPVLRYLLKFEKPTQQDLVELQTALSSIPANNRPAAKIAATISSILSEEQYAVYK